MRMRKTPDPIKNVKLIHICMLKKNWKNNNNSPSLQSSPPSNPFNMRNSMTIVSHTPKTTHRSTSHDPLTSILLFSLQPSSSLVRSSDSLLRSCPLRSSPPHWAPRVQFGAIHRRYSHHYCTYSTHNIILINSFHIKCTCINRLLKWAFDTFLRSLNHHKQLQVTLSRF